VPSTCADQFANETAVFLDVAPDHGRTLKRVERKAVLPYGHQSLRGGSTGAIRGRNLTYPTALQAMQGKDPTGLHRIAELAVATAEDQQA